MRSTLVLVALLGALALAAGQSDLLCRALNPGCFECDPDNAKICATCASSYYLNGDRCQRCPVLRWSPKGSTNATDCECYIERALGVCGLCPHGFRYMKDMGMCALYTEGNTTTLNAYNATNACANAGGGALVINYTAKANLTVIAAGSGAFDTVVGVYQGAVQLACEDSVLGAGDESYAVRLVAGTRYTFVLNGAVKNGVAASGLGKLMVSPVPLLFGK